MIGAQALRQHPFRGTIALVAAMIVLAGCRLGPRIRVEDQPLKPDSGRQPGTQTLVTLERRPCYGACPTYSLSIAGNGTVVFEGRANVDSVRRIISRVDPDSVSALVRLFEAEKFFALPFRYVRGGPGCEPYYFDAPVVISSLSIGRQTKNVEHDHGCSGAPASLTMLENRVDQIAMSWRWIRGRPPG